jgi:uncharacterized protein YcaQ
MKKKQAGAPTHTTAPLLATWDQVVAFRLARHHLAERALVKDLASVVDDMTGAQAQLLSAAHISLWTRVRSLRIADVEAALEERVLVKVACMRRTLFLVPGNHLAVFVRGTARRAEKGIRWTRGKGVPERAIDAAIEATLGALDRPLTRPEIAERVSRALGVQTQTVQGGGWGSRRKLAAVPVGDIAFPVWDLLHLAAARGGVCYGPNQGNEPTFVRADAWIPGWQDVAQEQAEDLLLRRYLRAFGPATAADFALWAGINLSEARVIWAREQAGLAPVSVEGWAAEALQEDLEALARAENARAPVRLLPYFDTFLLGHKEREHLAAAPYREKIYRPQGWIAPIVLVDGRAAAVWSHTCKGDRLEVKIAGFRPLPQEIITGIAEEAQDLGRFLGAPNVEIQPG